MIITEQCRYEFKQKELVELARTMARKSQEKTQAEEELESVRAAHKAKLSRIEADLSDCTRQIQSGYDMRMIRCLVLKFRPDQNHAMIVRLDTGVVVRERELDADEKQLKLTSEKPEEFSFECDFWTEGDTPSTTHVHVPLYQKEAQELSKIDGFKVRPLRGLIADGKSDAERAAQAPKTNRGRRTTAKGAGE